MTQSLERPKNSFKVSQSSKLSKQIPLIVCCDNTETQVALCAQLAQDFDDITACSLHQLPERLHQQPDSSVVLSWYKPCADLIWGIDFIEQKQNPLLVLTQELNVDDATRLPDSLGYALLPSQSDVPLQGWIEYAQQLRKRSQALDKTIVQLNQKLDDRKWVEQAKGLLMKIQNLDEQQAYQALRSAAMKNSQTIGQVAKNVIATFENLSV
ncbi:ANTAR domain-containing response regulator [Vibrio rumoiensis]|uniref:ANTAR domain-containing protein n=1 Tax=Vibrio rumoiensis 1S-45 TaxID=1188252 RepID=A0A1E5DZE0_9VIBR|nr:ANTAR domain-containing protein [Vibrio rumoiensis]OEF23298.1 hypothetical protein A1QC_12420 [Vibrio rumoiensis 1S-45]